MSRTCMEWRPLLRTAELPYVLRNDRIVLCSGPGWKEIPVPPSNWVPTV